MRVPSSLRAMFPALLSDPWLFPRRMILLSLDAGLIGLSFWAAIALRVGDSVDRQRHLADQLYLLPWAIGIGLLVLAGSGWYTSLVRSSGSHSFYGLLPRSAFVVLLLLLVSTLHATNSPPRSFWFLFWVLFASSTIFSRILMRDLLRWRLQAIGQIDLISKGRDVEFTSGVPTLIFGAGDSALHLIDSLQWDPRFALKALLDDDPSLWGRRLKNHRIHPPSALVHLIARLQIKQVLLAIPTLPRARKLHLVSHLSGMGLRVLETPSLPQIASGERSVSDLRPISIEDLLGREPSTPDPRLLAQAVEDECVLVTGAGGSIGSELCRQISRLRPRKLVLVERNEFSLYRIESQLKDLSSHSGMSCEVAGVLCDLSDQRHLESILQAHSVSVLFHAAAYKHVPLIERNVCAGVANNVIATRMALSAAISCQLKRFTLVSTDKAVRPTNAMGASKRVCELLVQDAASNQSLTTICSMVRFGNVLASSGSVVPRFRQQIAQGGPVTVTHPEITRYFMTIAEAAALVIQASALARGGEVFVLDMGEPVRIVDLARQMIQLSGLTIKDQLNHKGDIAITFTGLRPGEKLFEELLISPTDAPTVHPLIRCAVEQKLDHSQLFTLLRQLERSLDSWDDRQTIAVLAEMVPEYQPQRDLRFSSSPTL